MKSSFARIVRRVWSCASLIALASVTIVATSANTSPTVPVAAPIGAATPRAERREVRVLRDASGAEHRLEWHEDGVPAAGRLERVPFLGVRVVPATAALAAQLGLPEGTGLVVEHVTPKSPCEGILQEHDVLLGFGDQVLVVPIQLEVLLRLRKEGEVVSLTYMRAGQRASGEVKLSSHEVPRRPRNQMLFVPAAGHDDLREAQGLVEVIDVPPGPTGKPMRIEVRRRSDQP